MKRTAGAFMLLASIGGGCMSSGPSKDSAGSFGRASYARQVAGIQGPRGEPVPRGSNGQGLVSYATGVGPAVTRAAAPSQQPPPSGVMQTGGWIGARHAAPADCAACGPGGGMTAGVPAAGQPGTGAPALAGPTGPTGPNGMPYGPGGAAYGPAGPGYGPDGYGGPAYGGPGGGLQRPMHGGIYPVPAMGPPGAVAAIGALPATMTPVPTNARTSIRFGEPAGMRISWFGPGGLTETPLEAPARYNFLQGGIYRLKLSSIPLRPGLELYPTLEVLPATPKSATYLAHSSVPVVFTDEDFEQVTSGNFLVKVIYLPDRDFQDISVVAGPNEVVSSRLDPGVDPVVEAQRRGTILLIIRMGNIDLQAPNTPAMDAPNPFLAGPGAPRPPAVMPAPGMPAPGMPLPTFPPGAVPTPGAPPPGTVIPPATVPVTPKAVPAPGAPKVVPAPMPKVVEPPKTSELDPKALPGKPLTLPSLQ